MKIMARHDTALLLDAAGTLLDLAEPIGTTYVRVAKELGLECDESDVARRFPVAMDSAKGLRDGSSDWLPFWREVVRQSTGIESKAFFDTLIEHFASADAWRLAPGALACCAAVRKLGMRTAVVSNWDTRLRPLLVALGAAPVFDTFVISGEELVEKPDPRIFRIALQRLDITKDRVLHVGDSMTDDVDGARSAGCQAWHWGHDVASFDELSRRLGA